MAGINTQHSLEDQLRGMILSNGTVANGPAQVNADRASGSQDWRQHQRIPSNQPAAIVPPGLTDGFPPIPKNRGQRRSGPASSPFQQAPVGAPQQPAVFENRQHPSWQRGRGSHHGHPHPHHRGHHGHHGPHGHHGQHHAGPQFPAPADSSPMPPPSFMHRGGPPNLNGQVNPAPSFMHNGGPQNFNGQVPRILQRPQPVGGPPGFHRGPPPQHPNHNHNFSRFNAQHTLMAKYLDGVATVEVPQAIMPEQELNAKESFVVNLEETCQTALKEVGGFPQIELRCFGSIKSGFATKGSDIDLAVLFADQEGNRIAVESDDARFKFEIFRALEKALLSKGHGARLLTRTRVPILKFCESPTEELLANLLAERQRWEELPEEQKYANVEDAQVEDRPAESPPATGKQDSPPIKPTNAEAKRPGVNNQTSSSTASPDDTKAQDKQKETPQEPHARRESRQEKPWLRERPKGPLDYPKDGVGIQCDLNFDNPLGIYNSRLLHCYSLCDPRVRDMVVFVKSWAKRRKINSAYNGTLCSYGYVLMVLHYLQNVAKPRVLPDLLRSYDNSNPHKAWPTATGVDMAWKGTEVKFWCDEGYIKKRAQEGFWTENKESLGSLLKGFFQYYAHQGYHVPSGGFVWKQDAICFNGPFPLVPKSAKGWTAAKTEMKQNKQIRLRYLLAIVDPFETDHNVARTVTHHGIVAIRDEFRRAWDILNAAAQSRPHEELFAARQDEIPSYTPSHVQEAQAVVSKSVEAVKALTAPAAV